MAPRSPKQPIKASELDGAAASPGDGTDASISDGSLGPDDDDDDDDDDIELAGPPLPEPELVAAAEPALQQMTVRQVAGIQPRDIYRPDPTRHMSEVGPVAMGNFTCVVKGRRQDVKFGAPQRRIPREVQAVMLDAGVGFGHAPPPAGTVIVDQRGHTRRRNRPEPPRARRNERVAEPEKRFVPVAMSAMGTQQAF